MLARLAPPAFVPLLLLLGAACHRGPGAAEPAVPATERITTATDVLRRVVAAHADAPRTATFTQVNTVVLASGNITQRQRVLVQAPGWMRTDYLPLTNGRGAIHAGARAITFERGRRAGALDDRNPQLFLGYSIFHMSPEESQQALESLGIRTTALRQTTFEGAEAWVIGAAAGDTTTNQVWFDAVRWVPVRVIQSERRANGMVVADTRFSGHAAPHPTVPRAIEVYRDGRRALRSTIEELRIGIPVPPTAFDTTALRSVSY